MSTLRHVYLAFKSGAQLQSADIEALFERSGTPMSPNRLRELRRDSDRASEITVAELYTLISQWAREQRG